MKIPTKPQRILVITLRFLGDTLLTTALINSIRKAYPKAQIDVLTYQRNAGILEGNSAITNVIRTPNKPTLLEYWQILKRIFRHYDIAVNTQTGDRPTIYAFLAASKRYGVVPRKGNKGSFKRYLYTNALEPPIDKMHIVLEHLRLCSLLNIQPVYHLTPPSTHQAVSIEGLTPNYAVLHLLPQWRYKQWVDNEWIKLAYYLSGQGFQIVLSGSPEKKDIKHLQELYPLFPQNSLNLVGKLSLAQLADVISQAKLFIGPDTGITHLASATGVQTVALFGPTYPVRWTPWPANYHSNQTPFKAKGSQHINNVYLIQGEQEEKSCVPCRKEGCERHRNSYSECLDLLSSESVIMVCNKILHGVT